MYDDDQKKYPVLAGHLRDDLPKFLDSGLVPALKKFGDYANLDQLGQAFNWGDDKRPVVAVHHLSTTWGEYRLGAGFVSLTDYLVRDFEDFYPRWKKASDDPSHKGLSGILEKAWNKKNVIRKVPGGWAWFLDI